MRRSEVGRGLQSGPVRLVNLCSDKERIGVRCWRGSVGNMDRGMRRLAYFFIPMTQYGDSGTTTSVDYLFTRGQRQVDAVSSDDSRWLMDQRAV